MKGKKQKEPVGFNPAEIFAALALLEKERGIPQSFMMEKIVQALTTAYKRDHADVENVIVDVDEEHHDLKMFVQKNVVAEEDYVDPANEMPVEEAKRLSAKYEVGDVVNLPVDTVEFGRIAAGNGKQVIIQGLREAERGQVYNEFNSKQHEILTGVVTRIDPRSGNASLRIGTGTDSTEALLMAGEQVPGEELIEGMHVKVYVVEVRNSTRGPQVLISRTHPGLVKRLFELEVPEIFDGTVEVKSHRPGSRQPHQDGRVVQRRERGPHRRLCGSQRPAVWAASWKSCGARRSTSSSTAKTPPSSSPPPWLPPTCWMCGWRTRARPAASSCRTTSCLWPSARRARTPGWQPASPATRSTSSRRAITTRRSPPRPTCRRRMRRTIPPGPPLTRSDLPRKGGLIRNAESEEDPPAAVRGLPGDEG